MANEALILEAGRTLAKSMVETISKLPRSSVFNIYQGNFNKELHSRGTLAFIRTRRVSAKVQSVDSNMHSYTIQILISTDGTLHSPILIVLQEKEGIFGPIVSKKMKRRKNSRSHSQEEALYRRGLYKIGSLTIFSKFLGRKVFFSLTLKLRTRAEN